ncbi:MAG TPA: hypothetical protein VEB41_03000 [Burkholderiales bacterium]|nr:hypothetical protein [Burkholderiales bacterium]
MARACLLLVLWLAAAPGWSQPSSGALLCTGTLTQSPGMQWPKQTIEFSLAYGPGLVTPIKSDVEPLNVTVQMELDENALKAFEPQPRMPVAGNVLRVSALQVSRQTGRFTLRAELARESSGVLVGSSVWEGSCTPASEKDRKF